MNKKYVTTVTTEWSLRGDVSIEQINERLKVALSGLMMTGETEGNYAFTSGECLEVETVELNEN